MKKRLIGIAIYILGFSILNAQFSFNPTSIDISDINSNDEIVMMCNGSCKQYIKAYDFEGNQLTIDIPDKHYDQSFYKIKSNPKGEFLFGGFYGTSGDVIRSDIGSLVAKYDSSANLIFTVKKHLLDFENRKTIFSFISNGKMALSQGDENFFIYDGDGSLIDSILFPSKIQDIAYLNDKAYVVIDKNNDITILTHANDIIKTFHVDIDFRYNSDVHLSSFNNGLILSTDSDVIALKNIMQDSINKNVLLHNAVIRDIHSHNKNIHILSDNNLISSFGVENFKRSDIILAEGYKYQYSNLFEIDTNLYLHENFNIHRVIYSHIQNANERRSMDVSIEHMEFVKEIQDSFYFKPADKYLPISFIRSNIEFKNSSLDTVQSFILIGNNDRGFNCSGRAETYRFDSLDIPPGKSKILQVDLELSIAHENSNHPRNRFCYNTSFVNKLPNDNLNWYCDQYTKVENPNSSKPILIYPNPALNTLIVSHSNQEYANTEFTIINQLGYTYYRLSNNSEIDIASLKAGIYYLKTKNKYLGKFVKL